MPRNGACPTNPLATAGRLSAMADTPKQRRRRSMRQRLKLAGILTALGIVGLECVSAGAYRLSTGSWFSYSEVHRRQHEAADPEASQDGKRDKKQDRRPYEWQVLPHARKLIERSGVTLPTLRAG